MPTLDPFPAPLLINATNASSLIFLKKTKVAGRVRQRRAARLCSSSERGQRCRGPTGGHRRRARTTGGGRVHLRLCPQFAYLGHHVRLGDKPRHCHHSPQPGHHDRHCRVSACMLLALRETVTRDFACPASRCSLPRAVLIYSIFQASSHLQSTGPRMVIDLAISW